MHPLRDATWYDRTRGIAKAKGDQPPDVVILFILLVDCESIAHESSLGVNAKAIANQPEAEYASQSVEHIFKQNITAVLLARDTDLKENESHLHIEDHN